MFDVLLSLVFTLLILNTTSYWLKTALLLVLVLLLAPGIYAMITGAPFVITRKKQMQAMLKLGRFSAKDRVVELGCGDGRIIRAIAGMGVKEAIGYEFSIPTCMWAKILSILKRKGERIEFANFWKKDFSKVDGVMCFLLVDAMNEFEKKIWPRLKKGTRVVSNTFKLKGVKPVMVEEGVYLYVR